MRLSKLHASSSDSGDMRYETESNHSGTSFKGLISNGSVYYLGPNGGKSGTVTPDMESLIDDADLPYYNQLHTQQIQRHIGGFLQAPKKPTEAQPVGIAPKQSYSSAKQMISSDVLLAKNVPVFQGHVSNRENTQSYPQYASSDRIYNPSTSQSGTVSGVSLENSGKMRGTTANDPQAYVQQLASKISSHLMQQQQVQQRPTCPPVTTDQSHFATSHGIAGGYDMAPGHNLSKSTLHPDSNPSSYCKSSKTDKTHVTDGGGLHNIYTQKLVSSSFSDRLSKTISEDSYYSNPSSNHGIFGSNFQQQHQNHIYNATQPFNTSVADKSSYVNDFFDTSRSTGSDDFNFSTGAIRDIMEGTGPSGGLYSEQSDASLFVRITRTDSLQDYGDEKLMSSRHNNEDQLFNLQQDSQGFRSHLDPLVQNSFGDSSTEISKTPFGGLRKKVQ